MESDRLTEESKPRLTPWNKGELIGAKPPLRRRHVWSIPGSIPPSSEPTRLFAVRTYRTV